MGSDWDVRVPSVVISVKYCRRGWTISKIPYIGHNLGHRFNKSLNYLTSESANRRLLALRVALRGSGVVVH